MIRICGAPHCGEALVQRKGEAGSDYRKRLTCGPSCGSKIPRARGPRRDGIGVCRFCGGPTRIKASYGSPTSCNKPECRKKAHQTKILADDYLPWPKRTGEIEADFRAFNIVPDDIYGAHPSRPATLVKTASSIA